MSKEIEFGDVQDDLSHCEVSSCVRDENGQLVFYSGIYEWRDGSFHSEADPYYSDIRSRPTIF